MNTTSFHNSCSTLPIYNFYKASLFNDLRYLVKDYDEDTPSNETEQYKQSPELAKTLQELVKEYAVLTRDKKTMKLKKMEYELIFMTGRYNLITKILNIYNECKMVEVLEVLNDLEIKFHADRPIGKQIDNAILQAKRLKNKINIKRINFEKASGVKDDSDEDKQTPDEVIQGLDKIALALETNLELGYRVDVRNTAVERWINLLSMSDKRVAMQNNG